MTPLCLGRRTDSLASYFPLRETGKNDKGIHQRARWFMHTPPACADMIRIPPYHEKYGIRKSGYRIFGGDGGIRTLDLTDANRTLSQLSYAPIYDSSAIIAHFFIL